MKIVKFQPDQENIIRINNCVRLLTMGLQENIVTIWAVVDPLKTGPSIIDMTFVVRGDGATINIKDSNDYINSFINDQVILHLFAERPSEKLGKND